MTEQQVRDLLEEFSKMTSGSANNSSSEKASSVCGVASSSTHRGDPVMFRSAGGGHQHHHHHQKHHHQSASNARWTREESKNEAITIASDYLLQNKFPIHFVLKIVGRWATDHQQQLEDFLKENLVVVPPSASEWRKDYDGMGNGEKEGKEENDEEGGTAQEESVEAAPAEALVDASTLSKWARDSIRAYLLPDDDEDKEKKEESFLRDVLSSKKTAKAPYEWTSHAVRNSRRKMEDRHIVLPNAAWLYPTIPDAAAFAVYDGHGGQECADYARSHLFYHVFHSPAYPNDVCQALRDGMAETDARLLKFCEREGCQSGATAVCAIMKDNAAYVAWVGDSRAVIIGRDGGVKNITNPIHDTKNEDELARIKAAGGLVFNFQGQDRVNGLLNITRSLGDLALKPSPLTACPEVAQIPLSQSPSSSDICLLLASDGLFDGLNCDQIGSMTREFLKTRDVTDYPNLAKHLVDAACSKSSDNITVIVVFLKQIEIVKKELVSCCC